MAFRIELRPRYRRYVIPALFECFTVGIICSVMIIPIEWRVDRLVLLDQTVLPETVQHIDCMTWQDVAMAIKTMIVRGAPAIGVSAAFGMVLAIQEIAKKGSDKNWHEEFDAIAAEMADARPTAVNLAWAVKRMQEVAMKANTLGDACQALEAEAKSIYNQDIEINKAIGRNGIPLVPNGGTIMTVCNAGALATAGYGTALGILRAVRNAGIFLYVYVTETRPRLQGARLTAWELQQENFRYKLVTDNMAAFLMKKKKVDLVIAGADRIASNGDTANKIGTYSLAVLCHYHKLPFYVASPLSTIDMSLRNGDFIPIEYRSEDEITHIGGVRIAPEGAKAENPSFDVTPAELITAIVTEKGIARPPYKVSLKNMIETQEK